MFVVLYQSNAGRNVPLMVVSLQFHHPSCAWENYWFAWYFGPKSKTERLLKLLNTCVAHKLLRCESLWFSVLSGERADQLHHCLVRKLLCSRPQDPPADSEHRCKNHWCPSPLHPGHFPYTMLQQSKKYCGGPHPPLPQSLPAPTLR